MTDLPQTQDMSPARRHQDVNRRVSIDIGLGLPMALSISSSHGKREKTVSRGSENKAGAIYHIHDQQPPVDGRSNGKAWESVSMTTYRVTPSNTRYQHMDNYGPSSGSTVGSHGNYGSSAESIGSSVFSDYTVNTRSTANGSSASIKKLRKDFFRSQVQIVVVGCTQIYSIVLFFCYQLSDFYVAQVLVSGGLVEFADSYICSSATSIILCLRRLQVIFIGQRLRFYSYFIDV